MTLGDKLKLLRTKKGMTQEALAEKLNVTRSAIAKWENNNGIPEITNLKLISRIFDISLDKLLDDEASVGTSEVREKIIQSEYTGYYCDIDLVGWNNGVDRVLVLGEDEDFLYYQTTEKNRTVYGLLGKKYITSVHRYSQSDALKNYDNVNRNYFCNKHVFIEIALKEGFLKGFFDFRNDDYLDVIVTAFKDSKVLLKFGREINVDCITKIEELEFQNTNSKLQRLKNLILRKEK